MGTEQLGQCILIAEDDESIRGLFQMIFSDMGEEVIACKNGGEAIDEIRRQGSRYFKLALIDLYMPVVTGDEVARVIRQELPETIIVLVSAASDQKLVNKLLEEDVIDAHLPKPRDIDELPRLLKCSKEEIRIGKFRGDAG